MKEDVIAFSGFKKEAFEFLDRLRKDRYNNTAWFNKNRKIYEDALVNPAKLFIQSIGQFFNHLNPSIRTEPKFNKTIMRINNDMRFTKGAPYRTFFLIHFGRFKMDSEFYVYLDGDSLAYGMFINNSIEENLYFNQNSSRFKKDIINVCSRFGINKKFELYELRKEPEIRIKKFDAARDFEKLISMKYILLEKQLSLEKKIIYSPDFLSDAIKTFSLLYPLYCFALSPNPLKLVEDFDDRMGVAL